MESVQSDINPMMRSILLDWLVEVGQEYRLTSDTLFLSAAYIDRFLSLVDVKRNRLQLVGVTAMLVASKYEEIYAPQVEEFCYITDNTYTREQVGRGAGWARGAGRCRRAGRRAGSRRRQRRRCCREWRAGPGAACVRRSPDPLPPPRAAPCLPPQVLDMEREVLRVLDFDLTQPTIKTFLRRYIKAASGGGSTALAAPRSRLFPAAPHKAHLLHTSKHTRCLRCGAADLLACALPSTCCAAAPDAVADASPLAPRAALPPAQARSRWTCRLSTCAPTWLS